MLCCTSIDNCGQAFIVWWASQCGSFQQNIHIRSSIEKETAAKAEPILTFPLIFGYELVSHQRLLGEQQHAKSEFQQPQKVFTETLNEVKLQWIPGVTAARCAGLPVIPEFNSSSAAVNITTPPIHTHWPYNNRSHSILCVGEEEEQTMLRQYSRTMRADGRALQ